MPQAEKTLSVSLDSAPTGFFRELSPVRDGIVDNVRIRLDQISAMLHLMKNNSDVPVLLANVMSGIETALDDCIDLLSVVPGSAQ